jgi:hypothetical protein
VNICANLLDTFAPTADEFSRVCVFSHVRRFAMFIVEHAIAPSKPFPVLAFAAKHYLVESVRRIPWLESNPPIDMSSRVISDVIVQHQRPFDTTHTSRELVDLALEIARDFASGGMGHVFATRSTRLRLYFKWPKELRIAFNDNENGEDGISELLKMPNPLGMLVLGDIGAAIEQEAPSRVLYLLLCRIFNIARAMAAIRICEQQLHRLPMSLKELIDYGYLDRIPVDPFTLLELTFDREKRVIVSDSSVGAAYSKRSEILKTSASMSGVLRVSIDA